MVTGTPRVSVIVPTRNNARTIEACLASIMAQSYPATELLVVDNHSTDGTPQIAARFTESVFSAGPERSAQRNLGIERAQGEWILWIDSDMVMPSQAVEVAIRTAVETKAVGVALPERTIGAGFWTACRALERTCYLDEPLLHNPRLIRREYLVSGRGFDLDMSGPEDTDLRLRMRADNARIELAPVLIDHDEGRLTITEVMRKRYYYGRSIPTFAARHAHGVEDQGSRVVKTYLRHAPRLVRRPHQAVGMVVMRALEAAAYGLGARRGARDARRVEGASGRGER